VLPPEIAQIREISANSVFAYLGKNGEFGYQRATAFN